jgi:hypothetical protein
MGKRNNADGVVGLPDRNTGSRADHLLNDGISILWFIECRHGWINDCPVGSSDRGRPDARRALCRPIFARLKPLACRAP